MERKRIYLCLAHMSESGLEQKYIKEAFDTNWVVPLGPNVNAFEKDLEQFVGENKHVVALSAGTAAVHLIDQDASDQHLFCTDLPLCGIFYRNGNTHLYRIHGRDTLCFGRSCKDRRMFSYGNVLQDHSSSYEACSINGWCLLIPSVLE